MKDEQCVTEVASRLVASGYSPEQVMSHPDYVAARRRELLQGSPGEMDPKMVGVVEALRAAGYTTVGSCEGHGGERGWIGFIDFRGSPGEVLGILKGFGFQSVRFVLGKEHGSWVGLRPAEVTFRGAE